jgi:hypothetical protein
MTSTRYRFETDNPHLARLEAALAAPRNQVVTHPLYGKLDSLAAVRTFMEHHVFAVWDFMSLLKSLQAELTCTEVPWIPAGPAASRRLINEIVLVEESDTLGGAFISHFELYLHGMAQAGADTNPIEILTRLLWTGQPLIPSLKECGAPAPAVDFVTATWGLIEHAPVHCQAAAFALGREDLIPDMFDQVVKVNSKEGGQLRTFVDYLERHIEVDGEQHTPMAMRMLADLCGEDEEKWADCEQAAMAALEARMRLWDGIAAAIEDH